MRIKLDENLPRSLGRWLSDIGHPTETVVDERLSGVRDDCLWGICQKESRVLVTQDLDFADLRHYLPGSHHGLVLVRLKETDLIVLRDRLKEVFETEPVEQWAGCLVVIGSQKVRVIRPGQTEGPDEPSHP